MIPESGHGVGGCREPDAAGAASPFPALDILVCWGADPGEEAAHTLKRRVLDDLEWPCLGAGVTLIVARDLVASLQKILSPDVRVESSPARALRARMIAAHARPRDLLVCFTAALPGADVIGRLRGTLAQDPMFGAAAPRFALAKSGGLLALEPGESGAPAPLVPRDRACDLEERYIFPDRLFPCLLLRGELLANLDPPEADDFSLADAVLDLLHRARRCGFRTVVDNRAVVTVESAAAAVAPVAPRWEQIQRESKGVRHHLDLAVRQQLRGLSLEPLLAAAGPRRAPEAPTSLLLDCTGMSEIYNGTTESILGLLDGFQAQDTSGWEIAVMARGKTRQFFDLGTRYPRFRMIEPEEESRHALALRLSQVWDLSTWADLHRRALSVAVSILDTIAIDILYPVSANVVAAFQFTAEHADGLMYISDYSRQQFSRRFPVSPGVREIVHYLSFAAGDHTREPHATAAVEPYVLVVGNDYDHKDLVRSARMLADAFPLQTIKALGLASAQRASVQAIPSGSLTEDLVEALYARASCIVYPSFYEGFGLPILKGLGYGRTVIARRSSLLREIAERAAPRGRLLEFSTGDELITALGCVLHALPHAEVPLGAGLGPDSAPHSWVEISGEILGFARELVAAWEPARWHRRNAVVSYLQPR